MKFQMLVMNKFIHLRVIVFADYKDFEMILKRLPNPPFFHLKYKHCS